MKRLYSKICILLFVICLPAFQNLKAQSNQYLNFDGINDNIQVPGASALIAGSSAISIIGWFRASYLGYGHGMIGFRGSNSSEFYLIELNNGQIECRFINSNGILYEYVTPVNTIVAGVWQHYAWVYNGTNLTLYLNGNVVGGTTASGIISNTTTPFEIGLSTYPNTSFYYPGDIDEVSVWNKALSQTEIQNMIASELLGTEPNLKLYFKFNQGIPGGNNTSITSLQTEVNSPTYNGNILNFAMTGNTSNFMGTVCPQCPIVVTTNATSLTATTATLNGTVNANGLSTAVTIQYGLTSSYGTTVNATPATVTGNTVTPVLTNISGLLQNTAYHYRVVGLNSAGTTYGNNMTLITPSLPVVITNSATSLTSTSAKLNGAVTANSLSTITSFEYGLTTSYGNSLAATPSPVNGIISTPISADISGLLTDTTYHFRAKGVSSAGTVYGNDITFTTPTSPTVLTNAPSNITSTTATLNGIVTANGYPTTVFFEFGPTTSYGNSYIATPANVAGNTATPVSAYVSGLNTNTTYHYRCKGVNAAGTNYGLDQVLILQGTGVEENEKEKFIIFPVPGDGLFTVAINSPAETEFAITVFNELGIMVSRNDKVLINGSKVHTLDLRSLPSGSYAVVFTNSDKTETRKIMIRK